MTAIDVHLDVDDVTLRLALTYVLERSGCRRARDLAGAQVVISGDLRGRTPPAAVHVLVIDPTPAACRSAMQAVLDGRTSAVVCTDEPDQAPDAVAAARRGWTAVPARVVATARYGPHLEGRRLDVLHLVVAGRTNQQVARQLNQSQSTVKRDLADLMREFSVTTRTALVSAAMSLGYGPTRVLTAPPREAS